VLLAEVLVLEIVVTIGLVAFIRRVPDFVAYRAAPALGAVTVATAAAESVPGAAREAAGVAHDYARVPLRFIAGLVLGRAAIFRSLSTRLLWARQASQPHASGVIA